MANVLDTIWQGVKEVFDNVLSVFTHSALEFTKSLIAAIVRGGGKVLEDAATAAVRAAEEAGGDGDSKFAAAFKMVCDTLSKEGIPLITVAIEGAIIAAVAALNIEQKGGKEEILPPPTSLTETAAASNAVN